MLPTAIISGRAGDAFLTKSGAAVVSYEKASCSGSVQGGAPKHPSGLAPTDAGGHFKISQGPLKFNEVFVAEGAITTALGAWPYPEYRARSAHQVPAVQAAAKGERREDGLYR